MVLRTPNYNYVTATNDYIDNLTNDQIKTKAENNLHQRRDEIKNVLAAILTDPEIEYIYDKGKSICEVRGINLQFSESLKLIKQDIKHKLSDLGLKLDENGIIEAKEDLAQFEEYLERGNKKGIYVDKLSMAFKELIERRLAVGYLVEKKNKGNEFYIKDKASKVFKELKIEYSEILKIYAENIVLIANHNIYLDEENVVLNGISLGLIAKNNVVLKEELTIDLSGKNGKKFKHEQAFGYVGTDAAPKLKKGNDGDNGLDGLAGENGGNLYIKAGRSVINLDKVKLIKTNGGDGSDGQKGGEGQKGGKGEDVKTAEID